ncbi:MAG: electron transport complex subunit RsxA, partial [Clostridiales bacterium]|nr:electron transport complex subunit RsxA [Clostridiales bacterium]
MSIASIITIIVSAILTDNIVLSRTLGICPLLGTSKKTDSAVGMGLAVTFVITVSS